MRAAETQRFRASAEEALQVAARDAVLQMKDQLTQQFSDEIGRLVRRRNRSTPRCWNG